MRSPRFSLRFCAPALFLAAVSGLAACQMPFGKRDAAPVAPATPAMTQGPCVVLTLPASGPYAPISGKIGRGAVLARQELAADGIKIRLETVNTETPDWLAKLSALPPACAVVGGPLQARNYTHARSAGAVDQRAFFTFLPSLEQGDEGARAWLFPQPAGPDRRTDCLCHGRPEHPYLRGLLSLGRLRSSHDRHAGAKSGRAEHAAAQGRL